MKYVVKPKKWLVLGYCYGCLSKYCGTVCVSNCGRVCIVDCVVEQQFKNEEA